MIEVCGLCERNECKFKFWIRPHSVASIGIDSESGGKIRKVQIGTESSSNWQRVAQYTNDDPAIALEMAENYVGKLIMQLNRP